MASKAFASTALLLSLNLLFFTFLTAIPSATSQPIKPSSCVHDVLDLNVCVDVLGLVNLNTGNWQPCCDLIANLVKLEADACVCAVINLNILNVLKLKNIVLSVDVLLNKCQNKLPRHVKCA